MREASAALDRPVVPADGWRRLAAQLEAEGLLAPAPAVAPRPAAWRTYAWMALAATLLAGIGAAIMWRATETVTPAAPIATTGPATTKPATSGNARDPQAVETIETELRLAAEHYEKAIAALEAIAAEDRTRLDPAVAQVVERNLALIDTAIADSRNGAARASLGASWRREACSTPTAEGRRCCRT